MNKYDAKEIFGNARTLCPGLPEEAYWLCDYVSSIATPEDNDFHYLVLSGIGDILSGYCKLEDNAPFPEKMFIYKKRVLRKARYVQQLVDVATDEEFAADFRKYCGYEYDENWSLTMKRVGKILESNNALAAAANWWTGAIWLDRMDYPEDLDEELSAAQDAVNIRSKLTNADVREFQRVLIQRMDATIAEMGSAVLESERAERVRGDQVCAYASVQKNLAKAFQAIGLDDRDCRYFLPDRIMMYVTPDVARVLVDDATEFTTIWRAN